MGLSVSAVTTAVFMPKQRFKARETLYSPPPSQARNWRVVAMRPSPGSRRSITSPRLTRSQRHWSLGLIFIGIDYFSQVTWARLGGLCRLGIMGLQPGCDRDSRL